MICFYLGWTGSIIQIRTSIIKVGSKSWLLTCSRNITLSLPSYTVSALKRELNFCNGYLSLLYCCYLGIYMSALGPCDGVSWSTLQANCYTYYHIFNNLVHDVQAYHHGGNFIYSDTSSGKNTVENNLLIGAPDFGSYINHHCGLENLSKNNIIHR